MAATALIDQAHESELVADFLDDADDLLSLYPQVIPTSFSPHSESSPLSITFS